MDEKGLQLGGGRKARREILFFSHSQRSHIVLQSTNLQLITVIKRVSADGGNILLGFVFPSMEQCPEWSEGTDERIMYVIICFDFLLRINLFLALQPLKMGGPLTTYVLSGLQRALFLR